MGDVAAIFKACDVRGVVPDGPPGTVSRREAEFTRHVASGQVNSEAVDHDTMTAVRDEVLAIVRKEDR